MLLLLDTRLAVNNTMKLFFDKKEKNSIYKDVYFPEPITFEPEQIYFVNFYHARIISKKANLFLPERKIVVPVKTEQLIFKNKEDIFESKECQKAERCKSHLKWVYDGKSLYTAYSGFKGIEKTKIADIRCACSYERKQ